MAFEITVTAATFTATWGEAGSSPVPSGTPSLCTLIMGSGPLGLNWISSEIEQVHSGMMGVAAIGGALFTHAPALVSTLSLAGSLVAPSLPFAFLTLPSAWRWSFGTDGVLFRLSTSTLTPKSEKEKGARCHSMVQHVFGTLI